MRAAALPKVKCCGRCCRWLEVIPGVTFNRNNSDVVDDGLQILCRECDERRKASEPRYWWSTFLRVLEKDGTRHLWTFGEYFTLVKSGECHYCGGKLAEWGKGHKVDRIDSMRPHVPDNCQPCCSACNWAKGAKNPEAWHIEVSALVARHGRGKVPWDKIYDKGCPRRNRIPDLRRYVVHDPQLPLPLDGVQ